MSFIGATLWITSCGSSSLMQRTFEDDYWLYSDSLIFEYDNLYPEKNKNLHLNLEVLDSYAYQNLYIQIAAVTPDGKKQTKLNEFILNSPEGEWYAPKSTFGSTHSLQVEFAKDIKLSLPGKYKFSLTQFMRNDTLKGIRKIGFRIEDS